jgi:hypothetical protein
MDYYIIGGFQYLKFLSAYTNFMLTKLRLVYFMRTVIFVPLNLASKSKIGT